MDPQQENRESKRKLVFPVQIKLCVVKWNFSVVNKKYEIYVSIFNNQYLWGERLYIIKNNIQCECQLSFLISLFTWAAMFLRECAFEQIGHLKMSFSCRRSALVIRSVLPCRNILSSLVSPKINNQLSKVKKRSCDKAILIKTNANLLFKSLSIISHCFL